MSKDVEVKRAWEGMWIPREIWLSHDLTLMEKLVLVEIKSLDNINECFAKNEHFAKFFGIGITRVGIIISALVNKGYIERRMTYAEGTKHIIKRTITVCVIPTTTKVEHTPTKVVHTTTKVVEVYPTKVVEPPQQKLMDNNTVNNTNTTNTIIKSKPKENKPSNLLEVEEYFIFKKSNIEEAETFFEYYENIGWKVGRNPMKKWKLAANKWIKTARPKFNNEKPSLAKKYFPEMFDAKDPFKTNLKIESNDKY